MVIRISNEQIAGRIHRDAEWLVEFSRSGRPSIPAEAGRAGDGSDDAGWTDFPDAIVIRIGNEQVAGRIHGDADWGLLIIRSRRSPTPFPNTPPFGGDGSDDAGWTDFPDAIVKRIGNEQIAGR